MGSVFIVSPAVEAPQQSAELKLKALGRCPELCGSALRSAQLPSELERASSGLGQESRVYSTVEFPIAEFSSEQGWSRLRACKYVYLSAASLYTPLFKRQYSYSYNTLLILFSC